MKVAVVGASGKTGTRVVEEALNRGHSVVAVCRDSSAGKLGEYVGRDSFETVTAPLISDAEMLTRALAGCDAVVAVLVTARQLKATYLVQSLVQAMSANGVNRIVFTAGEISVVPEEAETYTPRQRLMLLGYTPLAWFLGYSLGDMRRSSVIVRQQADWEWTIVRAPTLLDGPAVGYRLCRLSDITSAHAMSREDYAACLLDSLNEPDHHRRSLTVVSADATWRNPPALRSRDYRPLRTTDN
jgi:putative NADH-flavin reductase